MLSSVSNTPPELRIRIFVGCLVVVRKGDVLKDLGYKGQIKAELSCPTAVDCGKFTLLRATFATIVSSPRIANADGEALSEAR